MRYQRSKTAMDDVSVFTPASQLSMGQVPDGTGGGSFLGALGQDFPMEPPLIVPDYSYVYDEMPPAADSALPSTAPGAPPTPAESGWNWQSVMDKAPAMLRDLMLARDTADYRQKIAAINLERAKRGQSPLPADQYSPMVQVGVAPQTMKIAGLGAGTFLIVAVASAFGFAAFARRRRA